MLAIRRADGFNEPATKGLTWTVPQQDDSAVRRAVTDAVELAVYETPRLQGYRCTGCGWTGDDPAAQAERKRRQAKAAAVERAVQGIGDTLVILDHRGKKAREEGIHALRLLHRDLAVVEGRLRRTELPSAR